MKHTNEPKESAPSRRSFLKGAAVAGGAVVVSGAATQAVAQPAAPAAEGASGYQETAHVRDYYRTARM